MSLISWSDVQNFTNILKHEIDNPRMQEPLKWVVLVAGVFS